MSSYVELHAASAFSFLEGASLPEALVERASDIDMHSLALLDCNGLYGAVRFHSMARIKKVKAHIGSEVSISSLGNRLQPPSWLPHQHIPAPARLPLLCASSEGYANLCQLITRIKLKELTKAAGAAEESDLAEYSNGLMCLTGGQDGPLATAIIHGGESQGDKLLKTLVRIFGRNNVFVELQRHGQPEEEWLNQSAIRIATTNQLPVIATNGVRYATAYEREIMDVLACVRHGNNTRLENAGRLLQPNSCRHLRTPREMANLFRDVSGAIAQTIELSQQLEFSLDTLKYSFPTYPVPTHETMDSFLHKRVFEGIVKHYGNSHEDARRKAEKQAFAELQMVSRLGFAGYFLAVWDIARFCRANDILVQGRGSAANSVICYALEITAIEPIKMGFLFERFLTENRGEWPDIDLDLPSGEKRERAISYIYQMYGELGAAMCANVVTYRGRSAAREVGKALGFKDETIAQLSGLLGNWEWKGPIDTIEHNFMQAGLDIHHPRIAKYLELTMRMQDLPRHLGQHSGGMVICQNQLNKLVPLERTSMPGRTVVQWDKEDCAEMKIIKVDLLGLGMMAVLENCFELITKHHDETIDLTCIPKDDADTFKMLQNADTVGVFQVESRAQMASLPRNCPKCFYDLVVQVAIIRPGPIVGKMMHPYMRRRQGKEEVTYPHPSLAPVLERTLGVPLFQEQLLRIAMIAARFSGAEAEELRRAVGMRRSMTRMRELEIKLRAGMTANKIGISVQDGIVQSISSFALYGFPESHAASFAMLAYASAYLKVNYLAAFTCAMLNNQPMGFYMPAVLVSDAKRHGLRVRPIDIASSKWECTLEQEAADELVLRMGLRYVKGLRKSTAEAIVAARSVADMFASTEDLVRHVPALNSHELTQLALVGALNSVKGITHRRDALWQIARAGRPVGPLLRGPELDGEDYPSPLAQMTMEERLVADYSVTGLTVGKHPMSYHRAKLREERILSASELARMPDGAYVRAAGGVIARQRPGTAHGFIFLSMEDETGIGNVIVHPDLYERERNLVTHGKFLLVEGRLQNQDKVVHVKADSIRRLVVSQADTRSHDFY